MVRDARLGKVRVEHDRYDYDPDIVPLEIVGLHVAAQVNAQRKRFGDRDEHLQVFRLP